MTKIDTADMSFGTDGKSLAACITYLSCLKCTTQMVKAQGF